MQKPYELSQRSVYWPEEQDAATLAIHQNAQEATEEGSSNGLL